MNDQHADELFLRLATGGALTDADHAHLQTCAHCREARLRANRFAAALEREAEGLAAQPMPPDLIPRAARASRVAWWVGAAGATALAVMASIPIAADWLASPTPDATSSGPPSSTTSGQPSIELKPGDLARTTDEIGAYLEPGGTQFGLVAAGEAVLVIDGPVDVDGIDWYRGEFLCSCASESAGWIFGWLRGTLIIPPREPGTLPGSPFPTAGAALELMSWTCPEDPQRMTQVPEQVRVECFGDAALTLHGTLGSGYALTAYEGDPPWLTERAHLSLSLLEMEGEERNPFLHMPPDVQLYTALADPRMRTGAPVELIAQFAHPAAAGCERHPVIAEYPAFTSDEEQLWCRQQLVVTEIRVPDVPVPTQPEGWVAPPGFQPTSGPGWRLLGSANRYQLAGMIWPYSVAAATSALDYQLLWIEMGLGGDPPAVDLDREVVVRLVPAVSGSGGFCSAARLDGIGVDRDEDLVYGIISQGFGVLATPPPENFACTLDANPHAFLVALDRTILPSDQFTLQLTLERLCDLCYWKDQIEVDLD